MRFGTSTWAAALEELELALAELDDCAEQLQPEIASAVTAASNPTTTNNSFFLITLPFLATIIRSDTGIR